MNIIFVGRKHGKSKTVQLVNRQLVWFGVFVVLFLAGLFVLGYQARALIEHNSELSIESEIIAKWDKIIFSSRDVNPLSGENSI